MTTDGQNQRLEQEGWLGGCLLWFFWGVSLSFMTILSLVLLVGLAGSVALNVYLGWQLSGLEVSVSRRDAGPILAAVPLPSSVLGTIPTNTPLPTSTATSTPTESALTSQLATLSAIATQVASAPPGNGALPAATPLAPATAVAIGTPAMETEGSQPAGEPGSQVTAPTDTGPAVAEAAQESAASAFVPPQTSSNSYSLIPIDGQRESRPPAEHGDLNLKLREPEPSQVDTGLVEIPGSGIDPEAPKLSKMFSPEQIVQTYAVHDWDWGCNCPGNLLPPEEAVLIEINTTPGEPVFIPQTERDIYDGKYVATVLYASEDSLTFVYARGGSVVKGYTFHYVGLYTDPNLIALFEESEGSELPGLTLDTPVGVAGEKLLVAVRDNGKFLDARSKKDWWE